MCGICGCGQAGVTDTKGAHGHDHSHGEGDHQHPHDAHDHTHEHAHGHDHTHAHDDDHSHGDPHSARVIKIGRDILEKNDRFAGANRRLFAETRTLALNLVSSPGAGKTSLLVRTLRDIGGKLPVSVIEGDQQTSLDADRINATGVPALQINTGKLCHLDADMISDAMGRIPIPREGILFIVNVGNLVCPAGFDLGEASKVVLVSVTEGEDKPLKYPDMFHAAGLVLVTKMDLLPYLDFDVAALESNARRVNPRAEVLRVSTRSGDGLDAWYGWIDTRRRQMGAV
jgi:hydrogenase nickel incorporation protein HypB